MKRIAFISHDASRTGAPILLINLIKLLKESGKYEFIILLRNGGELENSFSELGETFVWNKKLFSKMPSFYRLRRYGYEKREQKRKAGIINKMQKSDVIVNNTITNGEMLSIIAQGYSGKILTYIHELNWAIAKFTTPEAVKKTILFSDNFIVPSNIVKENLLYSYDISEDKITVFNYYINQVVEKEILVKKGESPVLKVGGCGTADWRKGIDIFISVAVNLKSINQQSKFKFIWKGVSSELPGYMECLIDIEKAGLKETILLLPSDQETDSFYRSIDVFFLASREDPYPLVVLEAASYSVPTICFQNAGGAPEFVQNDAGFIVPYLNIKAVADALMHYQEHPLLIQHHGNAAKDKMNKKHHDKELILKQFEEIIMDFK